MLSKTNAVLVRLIGNNNYSNMLSPGVHLLIAQNVFHARVYSKDELMDSMNYA